MKVSPPKSSSKFLSKSDLGARECPATIAGVREVAMPGGDDKLVVDFARSDKCLVVQPPILKALIAAFGDETDHWIGRRIVVFVDPNVQFAGATVGGIRVRPAPEAAQQQRAVQVPQPAAPANAEIPV